VISKLDINEKPRGKQFWNRKTILVAVGLTCLIAFYLVARSSINIPLVDLERTERWSIGIYIGEDPFDLVSPESVSNPVLTGNSVTDVQAKFVADPFMICENGTWYMFFEVMNANTHQGDIGLATSNDGLNWTYSHIVLDEPFHLSYPYTFKWGNEYYMIPESYQANSIRLYKAVNFPAQWSFVGTLLNGNMVDPSVFHYDSKWWLFTETNPEGNDILSLYYADGLTGPWVEHPESPIIEGNANIARPGGRVITFDNRVVRYAQDDEPSYGNQVRAFEITELTATNYQEHELNESPILKQSGTGWNADGMHNIDPHRTQNGWIACVDGFRVGSWHLAFGWDK